MSEAGSPGGRPQPPARAEAWRQARLLDAIEDVALVALDVDGRVETCNAAALQVMGYSDGEILGQHVSGSTRPTKPPAGRLRSSCNWPPGTVASPSTDGGSVRTAGVSGRTW